MNEYQKQALDFLEKANASIRINRVGTVYRFPLCDTKPTGMRYKYSVTIYRNGKHYSFYFYGSLNGYCNGENINEYDVLSRVEKYETEPTVEDFANAFGYDIEEPKDYKRVEKLRDKCERQYNAIHNLFGDGLMKDLREIY